MKHLRHWQAAVFTAALCCFGQSQTRAAEVLYDGTGFLQGNQSFVQSFSLQSAGTLTVTLTNVAWPEKLSSLNLLVTSASGPMGHEMGEGTSVFDVKAGEDIFAQWFGTAQGPLHTGVYSMEIEFEPAVGGSPVPLPTSVVLLLSGLGLLIWQRRTGAGAMTDPAARVERSALTDQLGTA